MGCAQRQNMEHTNHIGEEQSSPDAITHIAFPRPTADQLAALPVEIPERGFDPFSKKLLGTKRFLRSSLPEHAYAAFEAYQRAAWAFDDARLTFLVALHQEAK